MAKGLRFPIVLDLGTHNLRLIQVKSADPGNIVLQKFVSNDAPRELVVSTFIENPIMDATPVENALKSLVKTAKLGYENVLVLIPDHGSLINCLVAPPRYSRKEQEEAIREDIAPVMPLPIENWTIVHETVGRWEEDEITIALATIKSNLLEIGGLVQRCGLNPQAVDINFFNVSNLIEHYLTDSANKDKSIALVHLGNETTTMGVFKNGAIRTVLNRPIGAYDFTKQISKHFHVPETEAEQFKRNEVFFLPESSPEQEGLYNFTVVKSVFSALAREIFTGMESYLTKFREFTVQEVILSGGGGNFQNIQVLLAANLNCVVRPVGELFQVTTDNGPLDLAERNALAPACGALFRE